MLARTIHALVRSPRLHRGRPDLPGRGALDRRGLKITPLSAYVDAVATAAGGLDPPVILAGHSMGGFIIQQYLESARADLALLLASTSPTGALGMVRRIATRHPLTFVKTMMTGTATDSPDKTRDYFFSPATPADAEHLRQRAAGTWAPGGSESTPEQALL